MLASAYQSQHSRTPVYRDWNFVSIPKHLQYRKVPQLSAIHTKKKYEKTDLIENDVARHLPRERGWGRPDEPRDKETDSGRGQSRRARSAFQRAREGVQPHPMHPRLQQNGAPEDP
jgi:hypothetical protein